MEGQDRVRIPALQATDSIGWHHGKRRHPHRSARIRTEIISCEGKSRSYVLYPAPVHCRLGPYFTVGKTNGRRHHNGNNHGNRFHNRRMGGEIYECQCAPRTRFPERVGSCCQVEHVWKARRRVWHHCFLRSKSWQVPVLVIFHPS